VRRLAKATGSLTGNETMDVAGTLGRMGQRDPFRMVACRTVHGGIWRSHVGLELPPDKDKAVGSIRELAKVREPS